MPNSFNRSLRPVLYPAPCTCERRRGHEQEAEAPAEGGGKRERDLVTQRAGNLASLYLKTLPSAYSRPSTLLSQVQQPRMYSRSSGLFQSSGVNSYDSQSGATSKMAL